MTMKPVKNGNTLTTIGRQIRAENAADVRPERPADAELLNVDPAGKIDTSAAVG